MARIAFAWELGGELGHAVACWASATALAARGHQIAFMFRELHNLRFLPGTIEGFDVFQAPTSPGEGLGEAAPRSFPEILRGCGYRDPGELGRLIDGWRELYRHWKPDLVVEDFAPTALLAARLEGVARARCGNGFAVPPRTTPMPAFRVDTPPTAEELAASEAQVLSSVNAALAARDAAPLERLAQMFEAGEDFLCTFPELDHYGGRPASGYWGPNLQSVSGRHVEWTGMGPRVFVYVKRDAPHVDALIDALAGMRCQVIAFIRDLDPARRARLEGPGRRVSDAPLHLESLLRQCELVVSHGGTIAPGSLLRGIPQLVLPFHYEQLLTAMRLQQLGVGAWIGPQAAGAMVAPALRALLGDPTYRHAARAYAARYPQFNAKEQRRRIAARIEQLASR